MSSNITYTHQELFKACHRLYRYHNGQLISLKSNQPVGHKDKDGYLRACVYMNHRRHYGQLLHRLIFLMHHGYLPEEIDHINHDITDNRIENLRAATRAQNNHNSMKPCKSGVKGVTQLASGNWQARIYTATGRVHIGVYSSKEEAASAYAAAANQYHGDFAFVQKQNPEQRSEG